MQQIEIEILDDELIEGEETIHLDLSLPQGEDANLGRTTQVVKIIDDDYPTVSFTQQTSDVYENNNSGIDIEVTLSQASQVPVEMTFGPLPSFTVVNEVLHHGCKKRNISTGRSANPNVSYRRY
ncbi:MAG: hypothetical protein U5L04_05710 [Trueperaceae bacterium]|nr:hypothetical protein [Trueperaceae bacterium]